MLKAFCDKCGSVCEQSHSNSRRFEAIAYRQDGQKIGIEALPLFNGQASQGHICDQCFTGLLRTILKSRVEDTDSLNAKIVEMQRDFGETIVKLRESKAENHKLNNEINALQRLVDQERSETSKWQLRVNQLKQESEKHEDSMNKGYLATLNQNKRDFELKVKKLEQEFETKLKNELANQESNLARVWQAKLKQRDE